jgi:hypothetical protein
LQFQRTLFVSSNPDQDKQSTELRNAGAFAERNGIGKIAETRMDIGSPTRARTFYVGLLVNPPR